MRWGCSGFMEGFVADSWKGLRLGRFMEKVCAVEDSRKRVFALWWVHGEGENEDGGGRQLHLCGAAVAVGWQ